MKVQVSRISDEGFIKTFSQENAWASQKFAKSFQEHWKKDEPLSGSLQIQKTGENLFFKGQLNFNYHADCDRCLNSFIIPMKVNVERWMAPLEKSKRQREIESAEEAELNADDVNFSFYRGDEIDLGEMLAEQAFLDLPMVFLCQPECKGLCKFCGGNLNDRLCDCDEKQRLKESPFGVLKKLQKK